MSDFPLTDDEGLPLPNEPGLPDYIAEFHQFTRDESQRRLVEQAAYKLQALDNPTDPSVWGVRNGNINGWIGRRGD